MSYRLKPSEPLSDALRRLSHVQIARTLAAPKRGSAAAAWVHETRKTLKRLRALLRLVRFGLAKKEWRRANDDLRSIGRRLSTLRERDVLPQSIAQLRTKATPDTAAAFDRLSVELSKTAVASARKRVSVRLDDVGTALEAADELLSDLDFKGSSLEILSEGLAATHRAGRRAFAAVQRDPTDDAMHEARKVVQVHWRQMQLLELGWPEMLRIRVATSKNVARDLGDHHDLAMVIEAAHGAARGGLAQADADLIVAVCRREQATLERHALPSVARLFAADPQAFATEVVAYWRLADVASDAPSRPKKKLKIEAA